jgi:hypothetical protein
MARGTPRKVHVTPSDVIRPHHVYPFTLKLRASKVCALVHSPSPDFRNFGLSLDNQQSLSLLQPTIDIHFAIPFFGGVHLSSLPIFRFCEFRRVLMTNPCMTYQYIMVKLSPHIYGVDLFRDLEALDFGSLCLIAPRFSRLSNSDRLPG